MSIGNYFDKRSKPFFIGFGLVCISLIAVFDYYTGWEISVSILYLIPIIFVTGHSNRFVGISLSIVSALTWLTIEIISQHPYSHLMVAFWDMFIRLGFFLTAVYYFSALKNREAELLKKSHELALSNKELSRSNFELEQFAAVASHDLKEPLRVISQYLQLTDKKCKDIMSSDAAKYIGGSVRAAERMDMIINDLLDYSHVFKQERNFAPIDCSKILKQALDNIAVMVEKSGAVITSDPLPTLTVVESELIRLFQNLIVNAVKYKGQDSPRIHVAAGRNGNEWVFSVRDNGIGIESQYYGKIFKIFQRLHTREAYPGTGIGLAICEKIVENYGGRIWVESEPGKGSTFYFAIPEQGGRIHEG